MDGKCSFGTWPLGNLRPNQIAFGSQKRILSLCRYGLLCPPLPSRCAASGPSKRPRPPVRRRTRKHLGLLHWLARRLAGTRGHLACLGWPHKQECLHGRWRQTMRGIETDISISMPLHVYVPPGESAQHVDGGVGDAQFHRLPYVLKFFNVFWRQFDDAKFVSSCNGGPQRRERTFRRGGRGLFWPIGLPEKNKRNKCVSNGASG